MIISSPLISSSLINVVNSARSLKMAVLLDVSRLLIDIRVRQFLVQLRLPQLSLVITNCMRFDTSGDMMWSTSDVGWLRYNPAT